MAGPEPLSVGGDPRDDRTEGRGGGLIAVVLLALGSGAAALYSLFVFPYVSDTCGVPDTRFICTAQGQHAVAVGPLMAAGAGTVVAACSLALRPHYRPLGIALGYAVGFGGFAIALIIIGQE